MILAVDVGYFGQGARAAGVLFRGWESGTIDSEIFIDLPQMEAYILGEFFRRELPPIEKVVASVSAPLETASLSMAMRHWVIPQQA